jgi:hypothetical protein
MNWFSVLLVLVTLFVAGRPVQSVAQNADPAAIQDQLIRRNLEILQRQQANRERRRQQSPSLQSAPSPGLEGPLPDDPLPTMHCTTTNNGDGTADTDCY